MQKLGTSHNPDEVYRNHYGAPFVGLIFRMADWYLLDRERQAARHLARLLGFLAKEGRDLLPFTGAAIMINADLTAIAFGAFNLLRLASYLPQIAAVARDRHGATAISFSCWSIWIGANTSTALYAWINLSDLNLAVISAFNAACCATVLLLAVYKRLRVQRCWSAYEAVIPSAAIHT